MLFWSLLTACSFWNGRQASRQLQALTSALPRSDNCSGCWSSPLTAQRADDSYEEGKFLGRGVCAVSLNQDVSDLQLVKRVAQKQMRKV